MILFLELTGKLCDAILLTVCYDRFLCFLFFLYQKLLCVCVFFFFFFVFFFLFLCFFNYGYFLWIGFNCHKARDPLREGSLLFTTTFPEISGTHFINFRRTKGLVDLGATQWFWRRDSWIGSPAPKIVSIALWRRWLHSIQL